jgi:hypothetical protein
MPSGSILTGKEGREATRHVNSLRAAVEKRAKEKGLTLFEALQEILSEGLFSASNRDRDARILNLLREKNGSKGWARGCLARLVADKSTELLSRDSGLSGALTFKKATEIVLKENPHLLMDYRRDVEVLK